MNTTNFEAFNRISLYVLVALFEVFPDYLDLDAKSIGIKAKPNDPNESFEDVWDNMELSRNSINWLQQEGFISVENKPYGPEFVGVRLTLKGLTLLGYQEPSLQKDEKYANFIDKAQDVLLHGGRDASVQIVKDIFLRSISYMPTILGSC